MKLSSACWRPSSVHLGRGSGCDATLFLSAPRDPCSRRRVAAALRNTRPRTCCRYRAGPADSDVVPESSTSSGLGSWRLSTAGQVGEDEYCDLSEATERYSTDREASPERDVAEREIARVRSVRRVVGETFSRGGDA